MGFYLAEVDPEDARLLAMVRQHLTGFDAVEPYFTAASSPLTEKIASTLPKGITVTAPGFYAPQGRKVRAAAKFPNLISQLNSFRDGDLRITNLEMETAGIYALAKVLGHRALSINAILASRVKFAFSNNPQQVVDQAIRHVLERI